jgi:hypothetical protein
MNVNGDVEGAVLYPRIMIIAAALEMKNHTKGPIINRWLIRFGMRLSFFRHLAVRRSGSVRNRP